MTLWQVVGILKIYYIILVVVNIFYLAVIPLQYDYVALYFSSLETSINLTIYFVFCCFESISITALACWFEINIKETFNFTILIIVVPIILSALKLFVIVLSSFLINSILNIIFSEKSNYITALLYCFIIHLHQIYIECHWDVFILHYSKDSSTYPMVVSLVQWPAVKGLFNCRISGASTDSRYNVTRSFISIWHRRPSGPGIQKICLKSIPKSTWSSISFEILWSTHKWVHGRKDVLGKIFVSLCIFARNSFTT